NIISGNLDSGVHIKSGSGGSSASNKNDFIKGNYIGTDVTGTKAIKNAFDGVLIEFVSLMTIGGEAAGAGNLISGNGNSGVHISYSDHSTVQGNLIGTDATGENAIGDGGAGVLIDQGSTYNTVGGTTAGARN